MMTDPASGGVGLQVAGHQSDPPFHALSDEQWMIGYLSCAGK
jgi:hypothetical protein